MLPIPFEKYIPEYFKRDEKLISFANKVDYWLESFKVDTLCINDMVDPVKIRNNLLIELGYLLDAGINQLDSDRVKRQKITTAVKGHKKRGTWADDAKPKIDAIAGGDSKIISGVGGDDWILTGDGETPLSYYWAVMGADGIDLEQGISLIGDGAEIEIPGNIFIDVDNESLTEEQVNDIVLELENDVVPAYYRVIIGYVDGAGGFNTYYVIG